MSNIDNILDELLNPPRQFGFSSSRSRHRSNRNSGSSGSFQALASLNQQEDTTLDNLGPREQYRYRLAQTVNQLLGPSSDEAQIITNIINKADTEKLPELQRRIEEGDFEGIVGEIFGGESFVERNVGDPAASALGWTFDKLNRPLNAFTGGLTEILRDDPGLSGGLATAFGRGAERGFLNREHYGTNAILNEVSQYEIGGHNIPIPESGKPRTIANFAGDVILDPLTYLGFGANKPNVADETVSGARRFVEDATQSSEVHQFERMNRNTRGPIVESIIDDIYKPKRTASGAFRPRSAEELAMREATEVYDPTINQVVKRPDFFPSKKPTTYKARENLARRIIEEDELRRLAGDQHIPRLSNYIDTQSETARRGYLSVRFAGRELLGGDNIVSRALYRPIGFGRWHLGYNSEGEKRLLNEWFNPRDQTLGDLPDMVRRAQGNFAGVGEANLSDIAKLRGLVTDNELDQIAEALNTLDITAGALPDTILAHLDSIPLDKKTISYSFSLQDINELDLDTVGDVARALKLHMDNLTALEMQLGVRKTGELPEIFPLTTKGKRVLTKADRKLPLAELKRRGFQFVDPLEAYAENISFRLNRLADAEAVGNALESFLVTVPDPLSNTRKVQPISPGAKLVRRESEAGQAVENNVLGDYDPITQELLRGPETTEEMVELAKQAKSQGRVKSGTMEFVPVTKVDNRIIQNLLKDSAYNLKNNTYLIPRPIADALHELDNFTYNPTRAGQYLRTYDAIMSKWKKTVTVYNSGYHARNMFSDFFMNVAAGVANPHRYDQALRVITERFNHNIDDALGSLEGAPFRKIAKSKIAHIKINGELVKADDVWRLYAQYSGAKTGQIRALLTNTFETAALGASKRSRLAARITRMSEGREDMMRLAHFIDYFDKTAKSKGIRIYENGFLTGEARKLSREVGDRVRYYNLDYGLKTEFERKFASRVIPFYTFLRRNLTLQAQLLLTKPGVIAAYPKYQQLFQGLIGDPQEDDSTTLIPQWIQRSFPWLIETESRRQSGPIGQLLKMFGIDEGGGAVVMPMENTLPVGTLNQLNPILQPLTQGQNPGMQGVSDLFREQLSAVAPSIRVPFEVATGQNMFTGSEINGNWGQYFANQIPVGRLGASLASEGAEQTQESFMRWLTGLPIRQVTPQNEASEFRRREDSLEVIRRRVLAQVNEELQAMGLDPISSLPDLDSNELIRGMLSTAQRQNRRVQYAPEP